MLRTLVLAKGIYMSNKEEELAALNNRRRQSASGRMANDSKVRLQHIAAKKFRTCFIAALAEFEATFGETIWGHGLSDDQITQEQMINRDKWDQVRKRILDKGNMQSRSLSREIDLHKVDFEGYRMVLSKGKRDER